MLVWTQTRGLLNVLQLVFGLTYTNLSVYLRFGVRLFVKTFWDDPLAQVSIPSMEEIELFKEAFAARHPLLTDCWATMDRLKLFLQQSRNADIQESYYTGWTHNHYVMSVFCLCMDGTISIAFFYGGCFLVNRGKVLHRLGLWIHAKRIPVQVITGPIWFFSTDTT